MKRFGNLYEKIYAAPNLLSAEKNAGRGLKNKDALFAFRRNLYENLAAVREELKEGTYCLGQYHKFRIFDPKERVIYVLPYRDRVVQHALCAIMVPCLEKKFIFDSYANRVGKGTHAGVLRFRKYAGRFRYVLKCDIVKFFPSLNREIMKQKLMKTFKCPRTVDLCLEFVDGAPVEKGMSYYPAGVLTTGPNGLPIGNLTSQHLCNLYLNDFDHYVKETLGCGGYIRYVDDFALFSDDKGILKQWRHTIQVYLTHIGLVLHKNKTQMRPCRLGTTFLGFRVYPGRIGLHSQKNRRWLKKIRAAIRMRREGKLSAFDVRQRIMGWLGHANFTDDNHLIRRILYRLPH